MFTVASWNLNSVRSRLTHVTAWLKVREPDVLLLQELKGTEFPSDDFKSLGYESVAVTQKAYNGVAILSRHPMKTIAKALVGDESDTHARFLEVIIRDVRIVNVYAPNGNPVGSEKFAYKLAWMDRLIQEMIRWKQDAVPTLIGGDFNVIPEDIDCHKPTSWGCKTSRQSRELLKPYDSRFMRFYPVSRLIMSRMMTSNAPAVRRTSRIRTDFSPEGKQTLLQGERRLLVAVRCSAWTPSLSS